MNSWAKSKTPVIGIPVAGEAPLCVDGRRLRAWTKGVTISTFKIVDDGKRLTDVSYISKDGRRVVTGRVVRITGRTGNIKSVANFALIPRKDALATIKEWSECERERLQKKGMLGALTPEAKRAMRRAKYDDDAEGMVEVLCAMPDTPAKCETCGGRIAGNNCKSLGHTITEPVKNPKVLKMGTPIDLGVAAPLKFVVVRFGTVANYNVSFTVTETVTGKQAGHGNTAEKAIIDARTKFAELSAHQVATMMAKVASEMSEFDRAVFEAERLAMAI